jgi:hypothetical protein
MSEKSYANKNPLQVFGTGKGLIHESELSEKIQHTIIKFIGNPDSIM